MQVKLECFKCAVAFFFLFFLHGTSIGNGQQGISYNGLAKKRSHLITLQIGTKLYWLCFLAVVVCR